MTNRQWTTDDKTGWGAGPWQTEPDKLQWTDAATGLPCLIVRNRAGALCGYVGVSEDHPWFKVDYGDHIGEPCTDEYCYEHRPDAIVNVHGGLTYSALCQEGRPEGEGICHIPDHGQPDRVWWFGFDCNHAFDIAPGSLARDRERGWPSLPSHGDEYRTVAYVQAECAGLASQLVAVSA